MHVHPAESTRSHASASERRLVIVLVMTGLYMLAEVAGGFLTGSLALLADSGHLLGDVLGLAMAVAAIRFARRPATADKTYGFYRAEILAALVNSIALLGRRRLDRVRRLAALEASRPSRVDALPMLLVACGGLVVTLVGVALLHGGAQESLNVRGAFLEVLGDLLGSIGTIVAALIILASGWTAADAIVSALIGVFIVPRAWACCAASSTCCSNRRPHHLDMPQIEAAMRAVPGVESVHDLHIWTITSGFDAMSGHVRANGRPSDDVLHDLRSMLRDRFGIEHVTLQVEAADHADDGACCITDPRCFVPKTVRLPGHSADV